MLKKAIPLVFIVLWIVPVGWVGLMRQNYPLYPDWIAPIFRVTGVFESAPSHWRVYFIEIQDKEKSDWHYVDEKSLFASTPLGDRTRFQEMMNEIEKPKPEQAPKILAWIAHHLSQANPPLLHVEAVRIIHFDIPSETFLKSSSLADAYKIANVENMARVVVVSSNVNSFSHENR